MKKSLGIVLLILLFLQVGGGGYLYIVLRLSAIHGEMREKLKTLPDYKLTLLTLRETDYADAIADDHEVKVNGRMYDIARVEKKNDTIFVYALHDDAEDNLLSFLEEMINRSTNDKKPTPPQLIQLITLQFILVETKLPLNSSVVLEHCSHLRNHSSLFLGSIDSPPPRLAA